MHNRAFREYNFEQSQANYGQPIFNDSRYPITKTERQSEPSAEKPAYFIAQTNERNLNYSKMIGSLGPPSSSHQSSYPPH